MAASIRRVAAKGVLLGSTLKRTSTLPSLCLCGHSRHFSATICANKEPYISNTKPEVVVSKSGNTIVCYHPSEPFPYEHSRPIARPDPTKPEQTHEDVLRRSFVKNLQKERQGPDEIELAKMFHTTKHRWFPKNQKLKWQKKNPPRDREGC
ncbi:large ribosomal subunit protein mL42-like [Ptychodera flava]|uniref:large ribosomal subunit protein mL42-like n=1 Tax=Ptychodera flava TaxID=63121 RepID=UPI00396A5222